jgi:Cep192 domain 4
VKLTQFWQQLMLRLALIGAVLAVCVMWGGLVAPVSAETTASAPAVSLSPTSLSFGNHQVNTTSAAQTVTLTNSGNAALTIKGIGLSGPNSGDFHQQHTCSSTLAAGASCTISVTFTPTAEGNRSASLSIADNASGSPQSVALSGTGVVGMPPTGSDPNAQPPADNTLQVPLGWLALIVAFVAAAGIGTELISGRPRRSRPH